MSGATAPARDSSQADLIGPGDSCVPDEPRSTCEYKPGRGKFKTPFRALCATGACMRQGAALRALLQVARRVFRALGCIASRVRMRAGARELALVDDQVLRADRLLSEVALEDLARARRVARLRRKRAARDMRGHAVMGHRAPRMIFGRRLREPDVARVTRELPALECTHDRVAVADL